jgi:hypothetical protein
VRVPAGAGTGMAKITISLAGWREGGVTPATFEVPVEDPPWSVAEIVWAGGFALALALAGVWGYGRLRGRKLQNVATLRQPR